MFEITILILYLLFIINLNIFINIINTYLHNIVFIFCCDFIRKCKQNVLGTTE